MGSKRNLASQARAKAVAEKSLCFEAKVGAALAHANEALMHLGLFGDEANLEASIASWRMMSISYMEAAELTDNDSWRTYIRTLMWHAGLGCVVVGSHLPSWDPTAFGCTEESALEGCEYYDFKVCSPVYVQGSKKKKHFFKSPVLDFYAASRAAH